jgi:hypothetical protein
LAHNLLVIIGWLMVSTPLKNMSSSVGMIIPFPTEWKNKKHVPVTTNQLVSNSMQSIFVG